MYKSMNYMYIQGVKATGYIGKQPDDPAIHEAFDQQLDGSGPQAGDSNKLFKFVFDDPQVYWF